MNPEIKFSNHNQSDLEISSNDEQNQKRFFKKTNYSVIEISNKQFFLFANQGV